MTDTTNSLHQHFASVYEKLFFASLSNPDGGMVVQGTVESIAANKAAWGLKVYQQKLLEALAPETNPDDISSIMAGVKYNDLVDLPRIQKLLNTGCTVILSTEMGAGLVHRVEPGDGAGGFVFFVAGGREGQHRRGMTWKGLLIAPPQYKLRE